ncbi:hypothetical protein BD779DRAFT_1667453 [Infundibulicybe gibba]|nr:hypothetical protein BD779DRAFT_1667453 [Infundibulicybe gibba]
MNHVHTYRSILRELTKATVKGRQVNRTLVSSFRSLVERHRDSGNARILHDVQDALLFLKSQREHKILIDRYNPLFDLTAEERIHATARRVGLDMPVTHKPEQS